MRTRYELVGDWPSDLTTDSAHVVYVKDVMKTENELIIYLEYLGLED